ncbi:MAG TPA: ATP-binding cassette domain-containing protein [Sporichthyaceae bacterium]|jgi:ABC-type branched-subunit amino acid transport system ATPase component/ABC-type branched-subunit amino acid transport system permease subunit
MRQQPADGPITRTRPVLRAMASPWSILMALGLLIWPFLTADYLVFSMSAAVPIAILGLGLLVLQGWTREIALCSAGLFATACYLMNWLDRDEQGKGLPWIVAAVLATGAVTAMMTGLAVVSSKLPPMYMIVMTIGLQLTLESTIYGVGYLSGGTSGGNGGAPLHDDRGRPLGLNLVDDNLFYFYSLCWLAIVLVLLVRLRRSPVGLAFLLVGHNRQSAAALGIPATWFRVLAFTLAGFLAGVAGVLASWLFVTPPLFLSYRVQESLLLLAIPVVAGVDSMASVLMVAAYLVVMPVLLERWHIDQAFVASFTLGIGALFGSRGIGGRMQDLERRWRYGARRARTKRKRMATVVLRQAEGLADERTSVLTDAERAECLAIIERWLPPRPENEYAIRTRDVKLSFGAIHALTGASIDVPTGQMVGMIGPNGAGKTTLFNVITGFAPLNSGRVEIFGKNVTRATPWARAALGTARTFQNTRVITELTAGDNICAGAYQAVKSSPVAFLVGRPRAWQEMRRVEQVGWAAARLLGVDKYWDERVGTLEFSARRRIEIARAVVAGPRLLLLDEPAAGLDPASSSALFDLIRKLHEDLGLTVLIVEHYVKAVLDTCDLVYVLTEGAVLARGTPAEIALNRTVQDRYLGTRLEYLEGLSLWETDEPERAQQPDGASAAMTGQNR